MRGFITIKRGLFGILFLLLFSFCSTVIYANEDIGQYRILIAVCTTTQEAQNIQQAIGSRASAFEYITSLGYTVSAYITSTNSEYKVYVGNYPTYGEARYIYRALVQQGYQGTIEQISAPIPDPASLTGTADILYSQASAFVREKNYALANTYYTAFVNQYPTDSRIYSTYLMLGYCKTKLNDRPGALAVFQTVANSESPLSAEAQLRVGYTYLALNNLEQAKLAFEVVTTKFPNSEVVKEAKERLNAFTYTSDEDAVYKQAMLAIAAKKYPLAVEYLNQYTANYPTAPRIDEAYLRLANCKINLEDKPGAFNGYKQVIQFPQSRFAKDVCGELSKLAVSLGSTYIDLAIAALRQSPCLNPANQELGGFYQTYIAWLIHEKVPKTPGGKLKAPYTTIADESTCWEAITECRKVKELYPNASRYDLARSALIEIEFYCSLGMDSTVIDLAKQLIDNYPDQRKPACCAQYLIARSYENLEDYPNALESYQILLDIYTKEDNLSTADDLIALAQFRKAKCLLTLDRTDEAKQALQELVQNHDQSGMVIWAKQELILLKEGIILLTEEEMKHLVGALTPCTTCGCGKKGCKDCGVNCKTQGCQGDLCLCGTYYPNCGGFRPCIHPCRNCVCPPRCYLYACDCIPHPCLCGAECPCPAKYCEGGQFLCENITKNCAAPFWSGCGGLSYNPGCGCGNYCELGQHPCHGNEPCRGTCHPPNSIGCTNCHCCAHNDCGIAFWCTPSLGGCACCRAAGCPRYCPL
jgi:TolA-binding protein